MSEEYRCKECGFETDSKRGIGIHIGKKHRMKKEESDERLWEKIRNADLETTTENDKEVRRKGNVKFVNVPEGGIDATMKSIGEKTSDKKPDYELSASIVLNQAEIIELMDSNVSPDLKKKVLFHVNKREK